MNVLLVAKLSNQTLTENILSPLLKSSYVDHVYVLRDFPGDMIDGKVTYLSPKKVPDSRAGEAVPSVPLSAVSYNVCPVSTNPQNVLSSSVFLLPFCFISIYRSSSPRWIFSRITYWGELFMLM